MRLLSDCPAVISMTEICRDKAIDLIDEASASARLSALDAPDKAKEIADRIHEMDQEMERAIRMEAFDQMAEIKKQQDALVKKYDRLMKSGRNRKRAMLSVSVRMRSPRSLPSGPRSPYRSWRKKRANDC